MQNMGNYNAAIQRCLDQAATFRTSYQGGTASSYWCRYWIDKARGIRVLRNLVRVTGDVT